MAMVMWLWLQNAPKLVYIGMDMAMMYYLIW